MTAFGQKLTLPLLPSIKYFIPSVMKIVKPLFLASLAAFAVHPAAIGQQSSSWNHYPRDLALVMGAIDSIKRLEEICSEQFPDLKVATETAYREWKQKYSVFLNEIGEHGARFATSPQAIALNFQSDLDKQNLELKEQQRQRMGANGEATFRTRCENYGRLLYPPYGDIETRLHMHVAVIRVGPAR